MTSVSCSVSQFYSSTTSACQSCSSSCTSICFGSDMTSCMACSSTSNIFCLESLSCITKQTDNKYTFTAGIAFQDSVITWAYQYQSVDLMAYSGTDSSILLQKGIYAIRTNIIFLDPTSTQIVELGTLTYPFKQLDTALMEIFNNFYQKTVLLAIEENSNVLVNQRSIIDSVNLTITTYSKTTKIVNKIYPDYTKTLSSSYANLTVTKIDTQSVSMSSYMILAKNMTYNFTSRNDSALFRNSYGLLDKSAFKSFFFSLYNASFSMQNMRIIDSSNLKLMALDTLFNQMNGGANNTFEFINNYYNSSINLIQVYTNSNITIQYNKFNLTRIAMTLIKYNPDSEYCQVQYPGYLIIDQNSYFGTLNQPVKTLIYYNAMSKFSFTQNTFDQFGFAIENKIIMAQILNVCYNSAINTGPVIFNINKNTFSNTLITNNKMMIYVKADFSSKQLAITMTENKLTSIYETSSFVIIESKLKANYLTLNIDFTGSTFKQVGDKIYLFDIKSVNAATINFKSLVFSYSQLNRIAKIENQYGTANFNSVTLTNCYDQTTGGFQKKYIVKVESLEQLNIDKIDIQNSVFSTVTGFKISNTNQISIKNGNFKSNQFIKDNFFYIDSGQYIVIDTMTFDSNTIPTSSQANFFNIDTLICQNYSTPLSISNIITQNGNQLSLLVVYEISQIANIKDISSYLISIDTFTVSSNVISNDNFIALGTSLTQNVKVSLSNMAFDSNTISKHSLINIQTYSQDITFKSLTFTNNQGVLLTLAPVDITASTATYNQIVTATLITIYKNKVTKYPLINISNKAKLSIGTSSSIKNNTALSQYGLIRVGSSSCDVTLSNIDVMYNFAYYGGVFFVEDSSSVTCSYCNLYYNFAGLGSLVYALSNGKFSIEYSTIKYNYALNYYLIYMIGNSHKTSYIKNSNIYSNLYSDSETAYKQIVQNIKLSFTTFSDTSVLDKILSKIKESCSIMVQRSNFVIQNSNVYSQSKFLSVVIQSKAVIDNVVFNAEEMSGFLISALQSTINITQSDFYDIYQNDVETDENYIFQMTEQSNMYANLSYFTNMTASIVNSQNSYFYSFNNTFENLTFDNSLFQSSVSTYQLTQTIITLLTSRLSVAIFSIQESSQLILLSTNVSYFNYRAIDVSESILNITYSNIMTYYYNVDDQINSYSLGVYSDDSYVNISGSAFYNLTSSWYGGALYAYQSKTNRYNEVKSAAIYNSTFSFCESGYGGAVYFDNVDANVTNSSFYYNNASIGGSMYFSCCQTCGDDSYYKCSYTFKTNICKHNTAYYKGGCFHSDLFIVDQTTTEFTNNSAQYGINYSAYPFAIHRVIATTDEDTDITTYTISDDYLYFVSGQQIEDPFYFILYDFYDQEMVIENSAIGKIATSSDDSLIIDTQDQAVSAYGLFTFSTTMFTSDPGYDGSFTFSTDSIDEDIYYKVMGVDYEDLVVKLALRYCTYGEAISGQKCVACGSGTYSLTQNAKQCEECPDHATCEGDEINPDSGYWRQSNTSTSVYKCYYEYACTGGNYSACDAASGYTGILCHECVYDASDPNMQFTRKNEHECAKCPGTDQNIRTYVLMFLAQEAYIFFLTFSYYKNLVKEKENTVLIRIFTTYSQIISLIQSFDLNWPTIISSFFEGLGAPAQVTKALYSIDCLLKDMNIVEPETTIMVSLAITSLQPVIQFSISLFVYFFAWLFRMKQIKIKMLVTMTIIYYLSYPQIVKDSFNLFTCTSSIDGVKYLVKNTNIECFGSTHIKLVLLLGIPNMIVWIFGMPIFILYKIHKMRKNLDHEDSLRTFGFWYLGCKRDVFYWELLLEYKKLLIITITVDILGMGQSYQCFLVLMVLYLYFVLSSNLKPYKIAYLNYVSYYAEFAELCTFAFMMVYLRQSTNTVIDNLIFVLLIAMNSLFWARFAFYLGRFYYKTLMELFHKVKSKIQKAPKNEETKDGEDEFDKIQEQSEEREIERRKQQKKNRKQPNIRMYKKSGNRLSGERIRKRQEDGVSVTSDGSPQNRRALGDDQQGAISPTNSDYIKQKKIQKIKIMQEEKKQQKRKMMVLDGPVEIKLEDYIREEKKRIQREQKQVVEEKTGEVANEDKKEKERDDVIQIKDFNLQRDKHGHLLNEDVLQQINKLL